MELYQPYSSKGKCNREVGYGVEPTRTKEKRNWQRTIREEVLAARKTWVEIKQLSKNRVRWRHFVNALCSSGSERTMTATMIMIMITITRY
jgi:hypothetical protein